MTVIILIQLKHIDIEVGYIIVVTGMLCDNKTAQLRRLHNWVQLPDNK